MLCLVALAAYATALQPGTAHAYAFNTHRKIVERAASTMLELPAGADPERPPAPDGVSPADWNQYLEAIDAAVPALLLLRTGLPTKTKSTSISPLPGVPFVGTDDYPFDVTETTVQTDPDQEPVTTVHIPNCPYNPSDNLSDLNEFRIGDFEYRPEETASPCGLTPLDQVEIDSRRVLGHVLGWHAASIDNHVDDTVMFIKPTNVGLGSTIKDFSAEATTAVATAFLLPAVCIWKLFQGDACDPDEVVDLVNEYNPVLYVDGWIPGIGDFRSDLFTGLWHFVHVEEEPGDFNDLPGMYYPEAGTDHPGAFDVATMALADGTGLTLNAYASDGDDFYGDYDEANRHGEGPWMVYSMAHVEFSSLDNLARYGWDRYIEGGGQNAAGLGWPLHAIGDGSEPHHVVGTSSWGHVPYETIIEDRLATLLPDDDAARQEQQERILIEGFAFWDQLRGHGDVQRFIEDLARETRQRVSDDGDWAYIDAATVAWMAQNLALARSLYDLAGGEDRMRPLLEMGSAATLAFLTYASTFATNPGIGDIVCGVPTTFKINEGCVSEPPVACFESQQQCTTFADCPITAVFVCQEGCCLVVPE